MTEINTRDMLIEIDDVEYSADILNARWTSNPAEGSDAPTYKEAREGGSKRQYGLAGTITQDMAQAALWRLIYDHVGEKAVVTTKPYGNAVPTLDEPWARQSVTIQEPDGDWLGGAANSTRTGRQTTDIAWPADGRPVLVTAPPAP